MVYQRFAHILDTIAATWSLMSFFNKCPFLHRMRCSEKVLNGCEIVAILWNYLLGQELKTCNSLTNKNTFKMVLLVYLNYSKLFSSAWDLIFPTASLYLDWYYKKIISIPYTIMLTHWGRVTHICVSRLTITGSDNGLSPGRRQAIIWTNAGILLIGPLGTNFSENLIAILTFSFTKMRLKVSSANWWPFCLGLNVLKQYVNPPHGTMASLTVNVSFKFQGNLFGKSNSYKAKLNIRTLYWD